MIRTRGLGRVIGRRVPVPVSSVPCSSNPQRQKGLRLRSQVARSCGRGQSGDVRGREGWIASEYGCRSAEYVRSRIAGAIGQVRDRKDHEAISSRNDLVFHHVQADHGRRGSVVKMTLDGFPNISLQFIESVGLGEDRMAQSASFVTAFGRLLNRKNDLAVWHG